ncbi:MAG TPA: MASE3 domain-containing protein [Candidatus Wallbacteria bacterium]|nr:MASE3 domain-containing protein [Candidatus Wallbacteria bacterium]
MTDFDINIKNMPSAKPRFEPGPQSRFGELATLLAFLLACLFISQKNFLVFHLSIEVTVITLAACTAVFTFMTSAIAPDHFLSIIGTSSIFISIINVAHTFAYKGMNIFGNTGANLPTQLWIALKIVDTASFFIAAYYLKKNINVKIALTFLGILTLALLVSIFGFDIFPACYDDAKGLTFFKIAAEYCFIFILSTCIFLIHKQKQAISDIVFSLIIFSLALKILSSLFFTLYRDVYGIMNALGHYFHLLSYYFTFKAIVETNLKFPFNAMFYELSKTNEILIKEAREKKAAEEKLFDSETKLRSLFDNMTNPMLFHKAILDENNKVTDSYIIDLNPAFEKTFGVKKSEVANKTLKQSIPALFNEELDLISILGIVITSGEDTQFEYYSSDMGKWFFISVFRTTANYAATIFNDITHQKKIEDMLSESQRFFKSTFNSLGSAVSIIDEKGMLISANNSWRQLSRQEAFFKNPCNVGENYIQLCESSFNKGYPDAKSVREQIVRVIRGESEESIEEIYDFINEKSVCFQVTIKRFEGSGPVRLLIIYENITERKKSENVLVRMNQTFLSLTSNSDKNIKILTDICGELFETTSLYNKISNGQIKTAFSYNVPPDYNPIDRAEGHICTDVISESASRPGVRYIDNLDKTKYFNSDPNVKHYNLKTYLGKPVFCNNACAGTLCVVYDRDVENDPGNNRILEIIATAIGIEEERKLAGEKLNQMSRAIEQSASTIVITDIKGNIEYANPKFTRTTGYSLEEARGSNPRILKSGEMSAEDYKNLWESISTGKEWRGEFHNKRKNGELYWEYATISPLRNLEGEITHYLAVKEDITERKLIELELAKAKAAAESANQAKSEFLANMSHEIRTPMTSVMGMAELLLDTNLSETQKKYSHHIHESANLLLTIINDILDFSKIEAGKMTIENIDMNLSSLISNLSEMMGVKALEKNLILSTRISEEIPENLKGDPVRIRQILLNLLNNAIKFTKKGSVTLNVSLISAGEKDAEIKFEITDTGIGMTPEALNNLFKPFVQADSSTTRRYGGTGLGLSICKRLVEMMKGTIGAVSKENEGSTFFFTIRLEKSVTQDAPAAAEDGIQPPAQKKTALKDFNAVATENISILLADDNPSNQRVLLLQLNKLGYKKVHVAGDGREAVEMCSSEAYSLILMDCQMNVMDGFEATRIIRAKEAGQDRHTPIIALTADAMSGTREKCIAAGMDDYITKPIGISHLQNVLNKWLLKF